MKTKIHHARFDEENKAIAATIKSELKNGLLEQFKDYAKKTMKENNISFDIAEWLKLDIIVWNVNEKRNAQIQFTIKHESYKYGFCEVEFEVLENNGKFEYSEDKESHWVKTFTE